MYCVRFGSCSNVFDNLVQVKEELIVTSTLSMKFLKMIMNFYLELEERIFELERSLRS